MLRLEYSHSIAREGVDIEARTAEEKNKLKDLNVALNELSLNLSILIAQVLTKVSTQEINRMYEAVNELFKHHLDYLEQGSNEIAPDIVIKFPKSELNKVTKNLNFNLSFESGFEIETKCWDEEVWNIQENALTNAYDKLPREFNFFGFKVKKPKVDRVLVQTHFKTIERRSSDNARIPSTGEIVQAWKEQLQQVEPDMLKEVIDWLLIQIGDLKKNVDTKQKAIISLYEARLEKARQEIDLDLAKQKNVWEPLQYRAKNLAKEFSQLDSFKEPELTEKKVDEEDG